MHFDTPYSRCRFGLARCDITPPIGIYHRMWGAATHDRATGVHRSLTATAMAFAPADGASGEMLIVVAIDHCLLWSAEMDTLLETVCARTGLRREQFLMAFSHTHAAGLMGLERSGLPGGDLIAPYLARLAEQVGEIVAQVAADLQIAILSYGAGHCAMAAHRDLWDETTGQFVCGFNPDGPADDTVLVATIHDDNGVLWATLVNYACHPTTLAWDNTLISPDYPGAMREVVEQATGAPCVFLQGASGDLGPRDGFVGETFTADGNGRQLGYAALAVRESLPRIATRFEYAGPVISGATIGVWEHRPLSTAEEEAKGLWRKIQGTVELPYRRDLPTPEATREELEKHRADEQAARQAGDEARARDSRAMVERMTRQLVRLQALPPGPSFPLPYTLWRMGDAVWLAVEAEHYQRLQTELRRRFPAAPLVIMTNVNGWRASYLPTREAYGKGIYQERIAVLEAGCLETLIEALGEKIEALYGR